MLSVNGPSRCDQIVLLRQVRYHQCTTAILSSTSSVASSWLVIAHSALKLEKTHGSTSPGNSVLNKLLSSLLNKLTKTFRVL